MQTVHMRPAHPNQQQQRHQIHVIRHQGPPGQPPPGGPRPRIISQYHQRPPPAQPTAVQNQPPGQGYGNGTGIMLNVEHEFNENGKIIKKVCGGIYI